jgi:Uma2 family endonuclease
MPEDESHHVEVSEGVLIVAPRPVWPHQRAVMWLAPRIDEQLPPGLVAAPEVEVLLNADPLTVRAPDVVVTGSDDAAAHPARIPVERLALAVEVLSAGTRRTDRVTKLSEYADLGIPHYWILELAEPAVLHAHTLTGGGTYRLEAEHTGASSLRIGRHTIQLDLDQLNRP